MLPLFYLKEVELSFGDKRVLSDINLQITYGDKICLVGRNGCGKSSLMKIIIGEYEIDQGELFQLPTIRIGYLSQEMSINKDQSIYEFALSGVDGAIEDNKYKADRFFESLNIDGNKRLSECSGGQLRRAFLAQSLINEPDILLLDEPTNHLDIKAIEWLEQYLSTYPGAVICISHDRTFQENISNKVWWIDRGEMRKSEKGFRHYDQWREEVIAFEEANLRKITRKLEVEQDWLHGGVSARRKRNQQRLANLHRLRETYKQHQAYLVNAKNKLNLQLIEESKKTQFIIEAENISYQLGNKILFENFSFKVKKGEKIGIIGPNGIGKSTLIRILIKELTSPTGKVKHGTNLSITYFDQHRSELNPQSSIKRVIAPNGSDHVEVQGRFMHIAAYLKKFMFDPKLLNDKVSTLSGGQANRLLLAKSLLNPGNLFILDEPTNDLDMDSLEILLEILADYSGTLIIVSHDRDFLEKLVTRSLVFSGEKIIDLYGGYSDYLKYFANNSIETKKVSNDKAKKPIEEKVAPKEKSEKKLSYKYIRLLEILPQEMDKLEKEIQQLEQMLADSNLYLSDYALFTETSNKLQEKQSLLEQKLEELIAIEEMQKKLLD